MVMLKIMFVAITTLMTMYNKTDIANAMPEKYSEFVLFSAVQEQGATVIASLDVLLVCDLTEKNIYCTS